MMRTHILFAVSPPDPLSKGEGEKVDRTIIMIQKKRLEGAVFITWGGAKRNPRFLRLEGAVSITWGGAKRNPRFLPV
jgi:hypothetical protein